MVVGTSRGAKPHAHLPFLRIISDCRLTALSKHADERDLVGILLSGPERVVHRWRALAFR